MTLNPHEAYALCNRHASHRHMGDDLAACRDWIPGAIECDRAAVALAEAENLRLRGQAGEMAEEILRLRRMYAADLATITTAVSAAADDADARLADEYADRQLVLEGLIQRLRDITRSTS